jgi:hypothetical protein
MYIPVHWKTLLVVFVMHIHCIGMALAIGMEGIHMKRRQSMHETQIVLSRAIVKALGSRDSKERYALYKLSFGTPAFQIQCLFARP